VDFIISNHARKTHNKDFTAMFCVNSVETLIKYYELFAAAKAAGAHNLRVATIFSYAANEDDKDANGFLPEEVSVVEESKALYGLNAHSRDKLEAFIGDYNALFGCNYSTRDNESFYNYYNDISKRVKAREIDILLVVNMFLTGFDSPTLNTLYVDKNLKYHGLIQAYSRTNRILNEQKSQGNIVVFRNLKKATDEAITLFSNKDAIDVILVEPYEDYVAKFDKAYVSLLELAPTVDSVNLLADENEELSFIKAFRELMRLKNVLATFADFDFSHLEMTEQAFADYKSKYLDLYDKVRSDRQKEKVSILDDVDFELELIHRDEINVVYILALLANLIGHPDADKRRKEIVDLIAGEAHLRSKRELIEKFIRENMPLVEDADAITDEFERFWSAEQLAAFKKLCFEENLSDVRVEKVIADYLFSEREPLRDEVLELIEGEKPTVLLRKTVGERILTKIRGFVETFISGIGGE